MFELDGLIYDLIFDREITDDHYISPGGFEIRMAGQKIPLDFIKKDRATRACGCLI